MSSSTLPSIVLAACVGAMLAPTSSAQTTVGITSDRDNSLYQDVNGATSNGQGFLFCGLNGTGEIRRTLLHFDVAGNVPAGAVILSADLQLSVAQSNVAVPMNADVHRVLQDWGEGASFVAGNGGAGAPAAPGDATWTMTFFGQPGALWNTAGGDFAAQPSFHFAMPPTGSVQTAPLPGLIADVQAWFANPGQNFGWLLRLDEQAASTAHRINSRESASARPTLRVSYLLPGATGTIGTGCPVGAGTFAVDFAGAAIGGTTVSILYHDAPQSSVGVNFYSLGIDPIGAPLFANCTVYLPLSLDIFPADLFPTDALGNGASAFVVPAGFPGQLVSLQAAAIDATPLCISASNAAVMVLL
ncbi:MAG TPA: DNRLRE domain-containing protein [Planctomycetota bacterium]|nr:DNRLRE domain-containing protein [Planctomycetota bacterium]